MIIPVNGTLRISSDTNSWNIQRKSGKGWNNIAYYTSLAPLLRRIIKEGAAEEELSAAREIERRIAIFTGGITAALEGFAPPRIDGKKFPAEIRAAMLDVMIGEEWKITSYILDCSVRDEMAFEIKKKRIKDGKIIFEPEFYYTASPGAALSGGFSHRVRELEGGVEEATRRLKTLETEFSAALEGVLAWSRRIQALPEAGNASCARDTHCKARFSKH